MDVKHVTMVVLQQEAICHSSDRSCTFASALKITSSST
jgi:hypothetical protein